MHAPQGSAADGVIAVQNSSNVALTDQSSYVCGVMGFDE